MSDVEVECARGDCGHIRAGRSKRGHERGQDKLPADPDGRREHVHEQTELIHTLSLSDWGDVGRARSCQR